MKEKLMILGGVLALVIGLSGCGNNDIEESNAEGNDITTEEISDETLEEESVPAEEEKQSYAEKHPELDQETVKIFGLDEEYSNNMSEFFEDRSTSLYVKSSVQNSNIGVFRTGFKLDPSEDDKKIVSVLADQYPSEQFQFNNATFDFEVLKNEVQKQNSISEDKERWSATEYRISSDDKEYIKEIAKSEFEVVLTHEEGLLGTSELVFYKYIPLREGYTLEIRLGGDRYSFKEHLDEIKFRLDHIVVNPFLLEE